MGFPHLCHLSVIFFKHGSPTSRAPLLLWYSIGESVMTFKLVSEGTVRILKVSLRAAQGALDKAPSGTTISSSPSSKSSMGPISTSYIYLLQTVGGLL